MTEHGPQDPREQYADWKAPEGGKKVGKEDSTLGIIESVEEISPEEADRLVQASKKAKVEEWNRETEKFRREIPPIDPERLLNRLSKYVYEEKKYKPPAEGKTTFFNKESEWKQYMTSKIKDYAYAVEDAIYQDMKENNTPMVDFKINEFKFNAIDRKKREQFRESFSDEGEAELVNEIKRTIWRAHS